MTRKFLTFVALSLMCLTPIYAQDPVDTTDPDDLPVPEPGQDIPRERRAQTGFKFLSVSPDARAAAMGDAYSALRGGFIGDVLQPRINGVCSLASFNSLPDKLSGSQM